jgi:hypothetical protein
MVTIIVGIVCFVALLGIGYYHRVKEKLFIAKYVDDQKFDSKHISENTQKIVDLMKDRSNVTVIRWMHCLQLSDRQRLSTEYNNEEEFKEGCFLRFEPTPLEWKILMKSVEKYLNF